MIIKSICYLKTRGEKRASRVIREEDRVQRCGGNKKGVRMLISFERFICDKLCYLILSFYEPVERFQNRSNVMKFMSFGDSTSSRVKDKLKAMHLCSR